MLDLDVARAEGGGEVLAQRPLGRRACDEVSLAALRSTRRGRSWKAVEGHRWPIRVGAGVPFAAADLGRAHEQLPAAIAHSKDLVQRWVMGG